MSFVRRPGIKPKVSPPPAPLPAAAVPLLEQLARLDIDVDTIAEEVRRLRAGETRFVTAAIKTEWAQQRTETANIDAHDLALLDHAFGKPEAGLPHSSVRRRPGVRK